MPGSVETELKFILRPDDAAVIAAARFDALGAGGSAVQTLSSTYYDTPDRRLRAAGFSLRVRDTGAGYEQTVKHDLAGDGSLISRGEVSVPVPGPEPDLAAFGDGEVARAVNDALAGHSIEPLFTTRVERLTRTVATPEGDEVEVALDRGEIVSGDTRVALAEAEFELKRGDVRALFPLARTVLAGLPVRFAGEPKSGRGYRLVDGGEALAPVKAAAVEIAADATVEEALRAVMRSCFAQIAANVAAVEASDDPEGPHQLRVGLRRLRSAFKVFRPVIDPAVGAHLDEEARWLGREVGALRDLDVLAEETIAGCAGRIDTAEIAALVAARQSAVRTALLGTLAGERVSAFLLDLAAFTEGRGWIAAADLDQSAALAAPAAPFARKALKKRWVRTARMGADVEALDPAARHVLRKRFKALRYALEFLGDLLPRREMKRVGKEVRAAQEVLGYLNDVVGARHLVTLLDEARAAGSAPAAAAERAAGFCLGWHEAEAERVWAESHDLVSLDPKGF